jgi:hypothetical protein
MAKQFVVLAEGPSKTSGRIYSVRRDADGKVYCYDVTSQKLCSAWQFNKASPKTCKHIHQYYAETASLNTQPGLSSGSLATFGPKSHAGVTVPPPKPIWMHQEEEAAAILRDVLGVADGAIWETLGQRERQRMVDKMTQRLRAFKPSGQAPSISATVGEPVVIGVRLITFDD